MNSIIPNNNFRLSDTGSRIREAFISLVDPHIPDGRVLKVIKEFLEDFKGEPFLRAVLPDRGYLADLLESWDCWARGLTQKSSQKIKPMKEELEKDKRELDLILRAALGLARVEELDHELFHRIFDEETAPYLFVMMSRQIMGIIGMVGQIPEVREVEPQHIREISGAFDGKKTIRRVRGAFRRLGVSYIPPELVWRMLIITDRHDEISLQIRNCYWPIYDLFKDVFSTELVFEIKDDDIDLSKTASEEYLCSGLSILEGIMCMLYITDAAGLFARKRTKVPCYIFSDYDPGFLFQVDGIRWQSESTFQKRRYEMEEAIVEKNDRELLLMCLEKNVIPTCDVEKLFDLVKSNHKELIPLLMLKKHGCLKDGSEVSYENTAMDLESQ